MQVGSGMFHVERQPIWPIPAILRTVWMWTATPQVIEFVAPDKLLQYSPRPDDSVTLGKDLGTIFEDSPTPSSPGCGPVGRIPIPNDIFSCETGAAIDVTQKTAGIC